MKVFGSHNSNKNMSFNKKNTLLFAGLHMRDLFWIIYDASAVTASFFLALWFRFDCRLTEIPEEYLISYMKFAPFYALASIAVFGAFRLYQSVWMFVSFVEFKKILYSSVILTLFHATVVSLFVQRMPVSYYIIGLALQIFLVNLARFLYSFMLLEHSKKTQEVYGTSPSRVMLVGAGSAGQMILRDLHNAKGINETVCCIIDDDKEKIGRYMLGVPIVGGREDILSSVQKYKIEKIYLTMPSATAEQRRDILDICKETGCQLKSLPGIAEIVSGVVYASNMRDVDVEDLLGREPVRVNMTEIYRFIEGKVILVTGGGGSIGSELCRQIAKNHPSQLIVLDIYENNAHAISLELKDKYPELKLEVLIGSVRDSNRIDQVFEKYKPDIVYHAAAHKHVPLMEDSPCEAIKNNVVGTYKTAYAAMMNGCKRFVLISTDKAVNPTNIMGASKRICEMIVQYFDRSIREGKAHEIKRLDPSLCSVTEAVEAEACDVGALTTEFVAVRFGNVLGSNGSVVPRFKEQIAKGGPVTVTHPDIIRYFMTIPEAVSLVMQAGVYAHGGEIFVLDMGKPMKVDTLARNLIRLSGFKPDKDIEILYTGLRAGEKLFEEKLMSEEGLKTTPNKLIHIGCPIPFDRDEFLSQLQMLAKAAYEGRDNDARNLASDIVGTYMLEHST